jgi:transcription elongation factor Elf1
MMELSKRDERLIQGATEEVPKIHQPHCPRCHYEPLEFACNVAKTVAGHLVAVIWCGHCGHTINTQFLGIDQAQAGPQIVRPA